MNHWCVKQMSVKQSRKWPLFFTRKVAQCTSDAYCTIVIICFNKRTSLDGIKFGNMILKFVFSSAFVGVPYLENVQQGPREWFWFANFQTSHSVRQAATSRKALDQGMYEKCIAMLVPLDLSVVETSFGWLAHHLSSFTLVWFPGGCDCWREKKDQEKR